MSHIFTLTEERLRRLLQTAIGTYRYEYAERRSTPIHAGDVALMLTVVEDTIADLVAAERERRAVPRFEGNGD